MPCCVEFLGLVVLAKPAALRVAPDDQRLACSLLNHHPVLRKLNTGIWHLHFVPHDESHAVEQSLAYRLEMFT